MKTILLVCPSGWDHYQLPHAAPRWQDRYRVLSRGPDDDTDPSTFEPERFIHETREEFAGRIAGVASASDYPGAIVAAALAREMDLAGADPEAVFLCSHKYYSRVAQQRAVPEATPRFQLIDPASLQRDHLALDFPLFVKPVKSWFSFLAQRIDTFEELQAYASRPEVRSHLHKFVAPFNELLRRYSTLDKDGSYLLAEQLLEGQQVTVEGFVTAAEVQIIGIVDSVMYPGTISFQRFEYPSSLPEQVQDRMRDIATRLVTSIGLRQTLFNIEMFYDPDSDAISIIEINPRMCGQFADLYESVNGTNTYELLFALAAGEEPVVRLGAGRFGVAASFPLRSFQDRRVLRVPSPQTVEAVQRDYPVTIVKQSYQAGQLLSEVDTTDGSSFRYAVVNMAGRDRASLLASFAEVEQRLGFTFAGPE
jgi:biotin carboxylase